jgi:FtsZ-binding cell division protein ZapB
MERELIDTINNLILEIESLKTEISELKDINKELKSNVYLLQEYVSTL